MEKITKLTAVLLALCLVAGCSEKAVEEEKKEDPQTEVVQPVPQVDDSVKSDFPTELSIEKINTVTNDDIYYITVSNSGVVYETRDNKYGILSLDGKNDTGAIYTYCKATDGYFIVSKSTSKSGDVASMNNVGVVDGNGKVIVPENYAAIDVISDRYIKVSEVTEVTTSRENALVYSTDRQFSFGAEDGDTLYKGKWYVYDITTGEKVEGVSGTKPLSVIAKGKYISFTDDNKNDKVVNENGKAAPAGYVFMFSDGSYAVNNSGVYTMYDTDDNKLFEYSASEMIVSGVEDKYFRAYNYNSDVTKYFLLDRAGNKVTGDFEQTIYVYGEYILCGHKLYSFDGNVLNDLDVQYVEVDDMTNKAYKITTQDNREIIMKSGGEIIYDGKNTNTEYINRFVVTSSKDSKHLVYSYKDKDFTLEGDNLSSWTAQTANGDGTYRVIDTISGKELMTGYRRYDAVVANGKQYICAYNNTNSIDIYVVK